jgi:hypothetical protein
MENGSIGKMYSTGHFFPITKLSPFFESNENGFLGAEMGKWFLRLNKGCC